MHLCFFLCLFEGRRGGGERRLLLLEVKGATRSRVSAVRMQDVEALGPGVLVGSLSEPRRV